MLININSDKINKTLRIKDIVYKICKTAHKHTQILHNVDTILMSNAIYTWYGACGNK